MKQYKNIKVPNFTAEDWESGYKDFILKNCDTTVGKISREIVEQGDDWQPVPETPKMEAIEDIQSMYSILSGVPKTNKNYYLITNPTPEIKAILKAVENGKVYERYITEREIKILDKSEGMNSYMYLNKKDSSVELRKILIIPITESEVGK